MTSASAIARILVLTDVHGLFGIYQLSPHSFPIRWRLDAGVLEDEYEV